MDWFDFLNRANADYIEQLYQKFQRDPRSLDERWAAFFAGFDAAGARIADPGQAMEQERLEPSVRIAEGVSALVQAYRDLGHFVATLNPLSQSARTHPLLDLSVFGFNPSHLDRQVGNGGFLGPTDGSLRGLLDSLRSTYARNLGVEYMGIADKKQRTWLQERMEPILNHPTETVESSHRILRQLIQAEAFESFLHTKYIGAKRFSLQGSDSLIPLLDTLIETGGDLAMDEVVIGMAHRGRLNVLTHTLHKPYESLFAEFEGTSLPQNTQGDGDVKYHLGYSNEHVTQSGHKIAMSLTPNPSHLELVNPVVEGLVRARQKGLGDQEHNRVVPILIHGEAAFTGQGIVPETLNLSELKHYRTGGTIHIIVNNQLGFTATPNETRFTPYPTDVAKMIQAPIFHVNGEDPDAVVHAGRLAMAFRQQFKVDVMIDVWCYRKYGHNEADDPTYTSPLMYEEIAKHRPVCELYAERLIAEEKISAEEVEAIKTEVYETLNQALTAAREQRLPAPTSTFTGLWKEMSHAGSDWSAQTSVKKEWLERITRAATSFPEDFSLHPKLKKFVQGRMEMFEGHRGVDWSTAEMWAMGSLLLEGAPVRLAGQDAERGTFSHRHSVLHDVKTGTHYVPLQNLSSNQATFTVVNTMLSELAVLGFEFGFSWADPRNLVVWEAQFGDFVNGAQPIIDQFLSSAESKWNRMSGLVMLLPHGYEGQGPEHSSARLERFLQLCAEDNIQVAYPTLPGQYFHLLRRQIHRKFRKPLILMMPKSLLRSDRSVSQLDEFTDGCFRRVLGDPGLSDRSQVKRVVLCTGKVYFTLEQLRSQQKNTEVALIRVEQLYPFPEAEISEQLALYPAATEVMWTQEEPENMGAWTFMHQRLAKLVGNRKLSYAGREAAASPAPGSFKKHELEEKEFSTHALTL